MHGLTWGDLPDAARRVVEERCGTVLKVEPAERGIMPGLAVRLYIEGGGRVFLKGIPRDARAAPLYRRERAANLALAGSVPAPRMQWSAEAGGWLLSAFAFVRDARHADLSSDSPDLAGVLDALPRLGRPRGAVPSIAVNLEMLQGTAAALLAGNLDEPHRSMYEEALGAFSTAALEGDALLHYDLHPGNLLTAEGETHLIDWSFACRGAAWVDAALLVPRLVEAGHTPAQAEALMATLPAWEAAPAGALTGLAALWTMFREYKALYGPDETRAFCAEAAHAGRTWLAHRTGRRHEGAAPGSDHG